MTANTRELSQQRSEKGALDLTLILPYFNPGDALKDTVEETIAVLDSAGLTYEVIAVCDGSTDGSDLILQALEVPYLVLVSHSGNLGKGEAIRTGFSLGRGSYLGFMDSDGDIDPRILESYFQALRSGAYDIILGSKRHKDSKVAYPPLRRVYSWGYQRLVRFLFSLDVTDTQTGVKFYRSEVVGEVMPFMKERGYAFDLEFFVVARLLGYFRLCEVPVVIRERFSSTIDRKAIVAIIRDTIAVYLRLRKGHYRRASAE